MSPSESPEPRRPVRVLVDTNGWFLPMRYGTDLAAAIHEAVGPAEIRVPAEVLAELDRLVEAEARNAPVARALARAFPVQRGDGRGDTGILASAIRSRAVVLTGDRRLQARVRAAGLSVLVPRHGGRLILRGPSTRGSPPATVKKRPRVQRGGRRTAPRA